MRKRTINYLLDNVFWYLIYLVPIFCLIFYLFNNNAVDYTFSAFLGNIGLQFAIDNVVINSLLSLFGAGGILPLFNSDIIFIIVGWFICAFLVHLAVDTLLFIPRITHKLIDSFVKEE